MILWVHKGNEKKREYVFNYEDSKAFYSASDLLKEQGKQMRTVWDIPNNKAKEELINGSHPTQKPLRVAEHILMIAGVKGSMSRLWAEALIPFARSKFYPCNKKQIPYKCQHSNHSPFKNFRL